MWNAGNAVHSHSSTDSASVAAAVGDRRGRCEGRRTGSRADVLRTVSLSGTTTRGRPEGSHKTPTASSRLSEQASPQSSAERQVKKTGRAYLMSELGPGQSPVRTRDRHHVL